MSQKRCPICKRTMPDSGPEFIPGREDGMAIPCDRCKKDVKAYWLIGRLRICESCYQYDREMPA